MYASLEERMKDYVENFTCKEIEVF